jgi:hypothetical protein
MPITMAFITRFWRRGAETIVKMLALIFMAWASHVVAGTIEPVRSQLSAGEDGYVLSADFALDLGPRLEEAVTRGVTLTFNLEVTLSRPRWYWFDERVVGVTVNHRLSYNALTRQYRLSTGGLHRSFDTFEGALRALGRVGALAIAERGALKLGERYDVELRLSLDKSQLPKPLQVDAIASRDWQVESKVLRWQFTPEPAVAVTK